MNREKQLLLYKKFIENCTTVAKSVKNYTDFKRINECLGLLFPEKDDISILDFDDPDEFKPILEDLSNQDKFSGYNKKGIGNKQYSNAIKRYWEFLAADKKWPLLNKPTENINITKNVFPLQTIYYGTPGSGKSHSVKKFVKDVNEDYIFRTTFHPDSDYASFVGCYKPKTSYVKNHQLKKTLDELKTEAKDITSQPAGNKVSQIIDFVTKYATIFPKIVEENDDVQSMQHLLRNHLGFTNETYLTYIVDYVIANQKQESRISYEFCPQTFTKAYVKAWKNPEEQIYLIIEEINRGNCAQIFGDLFQLLDRKNGVSEYPIDADNDLKDYLEREDVLGVGHEGIANGKLKLPSNLNILATMNTSDQSLFPMDSAFKRRWSWQCVPIEYEEKKRDGSENKSYYFTINIDNDLYSWHDFLKKVNVKIKKTTLSEDKQMGNFFITNSIDERQFIDKVMFYLWNDICKDEYGANSFFRRYIDENNPESEFSFNDLFEENYKDILTGFMKYLSVEIIKTENNSEQ